ncbi:hypothetical protein [[Actinomadura] parvosata]|uniref:hypothetical protein n=1 Tax=[Actinomadura] parvosata TaxID=1955412 RepID=UPI0012BD3045|nr:hypothetical protein [Nonomuraea sp. ATCC 55076]
MLIAGTFRAISARAVERTVATHRQHRQAIISPVPALQSGPRHGALTPPPPDAEPPRTPETRQDRVAPRTRERHAAIHELLVQGQSLREIARQLDLGSNTVRRFARATSPEELLVHAGTGQQPKSLKSFDAYLRQRWADGCTNAEQLYRELRARGCRGSTVARQYMRPWRTALPAEPPPQRPPTVRQAASWFLRNPANLGPGEQRQLDALCAAGSQLAALRDHARHFADVRNSRVVGASVRQTQRFKELLTDFPQFRWSWMGSAVSMLSSRTIGVTYPLLAYQLTQSAVWVGWGCSPLPRRPCSRTSRPARSSTGSGRCG